MRTQRAHDHRGRFLPCLIPASDDKGFGVTVTARCAPEIARRVSELIAEALAKGTYPWKTKGDVIRWLLAAGLESIGKTRDDEGPYLAQHELDRDMETEIAAAREARNMRDRGISIVNGYINIHANQTAVEFLQHAIRKAHELQNHVWADWLVDELAHAFPTLVRIPPRRVADMVPRSLRLRKVLPPEAIEKEPWEDDDVTAPPPKKRRTKRR